jgi:hypothetical protein
MNIEEFYRQTGLENFFAEIGLNNLSQEQKLEQTAKIAKILHDKMKIRVLDMLDDSDAEAVSKIDSLEGLITYLEDKKNIDFFALITSVANEFKNDVIGSLNYTKGILDGQKGSTEEEAQG